MFDNNTSFKTIMLYTIQLRSYVSSYLPVRSQHQPCTPQRRSPCSSCLFLRILAAPSVSELPNRTISASTVGN